jgi:hypothetical protein
MSFVRVRCPGCDHLFKVAEEKEGVTVRCKQCDKLFKAWSEDGPKEKNAIASRPAPASGRPVQDGDEEDDDDEDEPGNSHEGGLLPIVATVAAFVILAAVGIGIAVSVFRGNETPQQANAGGRGNHPDGQPPHEPEKWDVEPDPGPNFANGPFNLQKIIDVNGMAPLVFSTAPTSPYVVLAPARSSNGLVVVDLRTMNQYGAPIASKFDAFTCSHMALSPDGAYLAVRVNQPFPGRDGPTKVAVWSVATGKQIHKIEIDPNPQVKVGLIDFLGKDQMFVMKHEHDFPDPASKATYQTWDLKTGKVASEFSTNNVYMGKWAGLSPGRRYMIQEETGTISGYHLLVWDLTTGKRVGDMAFQDRKDTWGQATGFAFSPDGEQVAMLWRLGKRPDCWGRLLCWDVKTGKKVHDHKIGYSFASIDSVWEDCGTRTIQWIPDKSGWLLFCHVLIDRESGAVLGKIAPEPGIKIDDRRFLDRDHISTGGNLGFNPRIGVSRIPWDRIKTAAP